MKTTIKYLAGSIHNLFSGGHHTTSFLLSHGVDLKGFEVFKNVQTALKMEIEEKKAVKIYEYALDVNNEPLEELVAENFALPLTEWEDHNLFFLEKNTQGRHVIGGKKPEDLIIPNHEALKTNFQYIGSIDCAEPFLSWLGMNKLHIVYPPYECNYHGIYLDYSDPYRPEILNPETFDDSWYAPGKEQIGDVEFIETRFAVTEEADIKRMLDKDDLWFCGVPLWLQSAEVPLCPKTNEIMRFVCTIRSDRTIKLVNKAKHVDDYLIFGDYGWLYIFFHPGSRILHINAQW